jgi:multiple sugar transport system substrate-binding protein
VAAAAKGKTNGLVKKLLPIVGVVAVVGILAFVGLRVVLPMLQGKQEAGTTAPKQPRTQANLTYWGLWEPNAAMDQTIADYQQSHPEVKITYVQQSPKDYRERLQSALAAGGGPDIFRYHNTWSPMLKAELDTAPKGIFNPADYFPVVAKDIQVGTELVGVPLMFDSLALYYNPRLFNEAGKTVPTTWEEVREAAIDMTVYNQQGQIQRAGIALGTTNNVDHFSDILGLMLLQNGANPARPTGQLAEDALRFYTLFSKTDRVWDQTLPASTYAFATEKVAMMLAPSWRAFEIKEINPELQFRTAPAPQLPGTKIAWASYWVEGVSQRSANSQAAWEFLQYLASDEVAAKLYAGQSNLRLFGEPYPKKTSATTLESDPVVGAFVQQGEIAQSWYLSSRTFDNGINDRIIKYYEDAVNAVLGGTSPQDALVPVAAGVTQVLTQYGVGSQ